SRLSSRGWSSSTGATPWSWGRLAGCWGPVSWRGAAPGRPRRAGGGQPRQPRRQGQAGPQEGADPGGRDGQGPAGGRPRGGAPPGPAGRSPMRLVFALVILLAVALSLLAVARLWRPRVTGGPGSGAPVPAHQ